MAVHPDSKRTERARAQAMARRDIVNAKRANKRDSDARFKALVERVK